MLLAAIATTTVAPVSLAVDATAGQPSIDEVFQQLGYTESDKKAITEGQIIATDITRTRDDQLIAAVALSFSASIADIAARLEDGSNIPLDGTTWPGERSSQAATTNLPGLLSARLIRTR